MSSWEHTLCGASVVLVSGKMERDVVSLAAHVTVNRTSVLFNDISIPELVDRTVVLVYVAWMTSTVTVEQNANVLVVTMSNPPYALMDEATVEGLAHAVETADADPTIGAVVVTGARRESSQRFLAHFDVAELLAAVEAGPSLNTRAATLGLKVVGALRKIPGLHRLLMRTPAGGLAMLERLHEVLSAIQNSSAVWVAAINGSALGGGCEVALACDVRFMARGDNLIGQPEIMLGFAPGGGSTQRLTRLLGTRNALRVILDGTPMTPEQAHSIGLVDDIVDADELIDTAMREAHRLGSRPKRAIGACKRAVYSGGSLDIVDGLRMERAEFLSAMGTPDAKQAMRAYIHATERIGDLPAYDARERDIAYERGRFA